MNQEAYGKILTRMEQIYSLQCRKNIKIEFVLSDSSRLWKFPDSKEVEHLFNFSKYSPLYIHPIVVEMMHEFRIDGKTAFFETYSYGGDKEGISVKRIECRCEDSDWLAFDAKDLQKINKFMLFDDSRLIDFDKFFKMLDLKILELV